MHVCRILYHELAQDFTDFRMVGFAARFMLNFSLSTWTCYCLFVAALHDILRRASNKSPLTAGLRVFVVQHACGGLMLKLATVAMSLASRGRAMIPADVLQLRQRIAARSAPVGGDESSTLCKTAGASCRWTVAIRVCQSSLIFATVSARSGLYHAPTSRGGSQSDEQRCSQTGFTMLHCDGAALCTFF